MPSNLPRGVLVPRRSTSRKLRFALLASAFPRLASNTSPPTCSSRLPLASLFPFCLEANTLQVLPAALRPRQSKILRISSAPAGACSSSPAAANRPTRKARCPGLSPARTLSLHRRGLQELSFEDFLDLEDPQIPPSAAFESSTRRNRCNISVSWKSHLSFQR